MGIVRLFNKIRRFLCNVSVIQYFFYNFCCKKIVRKGKGRLIPNKHSIIQLGKNSKIIIYDRNIVLGANRLPQSHAETLVRLGENATWECTGGADIIYGSTIEIKENAALENGYIFLNNGVVIIAAQRITIGEGCYLGRNVIIYDSDFHRILNDDGSIKNNPEHVVIGDRVWLTNNINVLKGVRIANGVVVSPYAVIRNDIDTENTVVAGLNSKDIIQHNITWSPEGF